jgi:hypothetical protein
MEKLFTQDRPRTQTKARCSAVGGTVRAATVMAGSPDASKTQRSARTNQDFLGFLWTGVHTAASMLKKRFPISPSAGSPHAARDHCEFAEARVLPSE